ncbi:hypothetical protein [Priestia megaterium]|nr:hypothetical protein [Priestia megaterium]
MGALQERSNDSIQMKVAVPTTSACLYRKHCMCGRPEGTLLPIWMANRPR